MYQRSGRIDAPAAGEYVHRQHRKADARKAEGRRADDAGQAEPEGEVPDEKLEQRSERQIGDDQQCQAAAPTRTGSPRNGIWNSPWMMPRPAAIMMRKMPR